MTEDIREPSLAFTITPEPTPEEEGAIVSSLALLLSARRTAQPDLTGSQISAWALAGRESAHHSSPSVRTRWSRSRAWLNAGTRH